MTEGTFPVLPVLIVDDEPQALQSLDITLKTDGINNTILCQDPRDVEGILDENRVEVILLDLIMPHMTGEQVLEMISRKHPDTPVVMITASDELETAIWCMKNGAMDYILKPVSRERVIAEVRRVMQFRSLRRENERLKKHLLHKELAHPEVFSDFDSKADCMQAAFRYIEAIAGSPEPVMITGDTGVGKELLARCVHALSGRQGKFVPVNIAGVDDNAFSDTLFGHKKGAFTGAADSRSGLVETAADGTLFLDEIGDLGATLQTKLLRLVQEREYTPLGMDRAKKSEARLVVATNKTIDELKDPVVFRADLYYRLRQHHVHIPPLKDRTEDIPSLVYSLVDRAAGKLNRNAPSVPDHVMALLGRYDYPGNVRELESMVFDAVSVERSEELSADVFLSRMGLPGIDAAVENDLPGAAGGAENVTFGDELPTLKAVQDALIAEAMKRSDGSQATAARYIGISRQALNKRVLKCQS